ncbi:MAG: acyl-CoA dehydrogenase [Myxococcales bacterium]|nr:MAG: acyl-CoA dehydrogenase [Myxococcales bacterium]
MDFNLTQEQELLRRSVRDFAENEIAPVAAELSRTETFSENLTRKMGELGLFGCVVSPDYGGQGMDYLSYIIAVEEVARVDGSHAATVAAGNSLGIGPIYYFGSEEHKRKYLPDLCAGKKLWGFGLTEPEAGSDAGASRTKAALEGGQWVLNGSKIFITNSAAAMSWGSTIQCITGRSADGRPEHSCILVENGAPGYTTKEMHRKLMWRASNTGELYLDSVRVPQTNLLGKRGDGFRQMLATLDAGRLSIGAMGLGCAQGAFEAAAKYALQRKQFGKPIASFQANEFKLADMAMKIEAARNLLYKACWLKDNHKPFKTEAAMAKLYCSEVAHECADHCVQLHGGYGLMEEYPAERFYRDQRLLEIGEGTSEVQRIVIARDVLNRFS